MEYFDNTKEEFTSQLEDEYFNDFEFGKAGIVYDTLTIMSDWNSAFGKRNSYATYELDGNEDGSFCVIEKRGVNETIIEDSINSIDELLDKLNIAERAVDLIKKELEWQSSATLEDLNAPKTLDEWKETLLNPQSDFMQSLKDTCDVDSLNSGLDVDVRTAIAVLDFASNEEAKANVTLQEVYDTCFDKSKDVNIDR